MDGPSLPRSMRWRLQLGVFKLPPSSLSSSSDQQEVQVDKWSFSDLWQCNSDICQELRWEYTRLQQEWMVFRSEQQTTQQTKQTKKPIVVSLSKSSPSLDPLSAFAKENTAQEKRLEELELKYKREKALRKRGLYNEDNDGGDDDEDHEYSSFASSLSLIEKDLHRLPPDHHEYHHKRRLLFLEKEEKAEDEHDYNVAIRERTLRLTEMLQIYAKQHPHIGYRQGMHELISYCLLVVEMDVYKYEMMEKSEQQSLPPSNITTTTTTTNTTSKEEVAVVAAAEEEGWDTSIKTPKHEFWEGSYLAHDAYGIFQVLMDPLAPAYDVNNNDNGTAETRGQAILELIRTVASDQSVYRHLMQLQCPPELYTTRWIRLLFSREVQGKSNVLLLWDVFMDLWSVVSPAPDDNNNNGTIVDHGIKITSLSQSRYTRPGVSPPLQLGNWNLLEILETAAASMILLQRGSLLSSSNPNDTDDMDGYSQSDSIHRLMNIPPLKNILPLTATLLSMMRRRQVMMMKKNKNKHKQQQLPQQNKNTSPFTKKQQQPLQNNNHNNNNNNNNQNKSSSSIPKSTSRNVFTEMADAVEKFSLWKQPATTQPPPPPPSSVTTTTTKPSVVVPTPKKNENQQPDGTKHAIITKTTITNSSSNNNTTIIPNNTTTREKNNNLSNQLNDSISTVKQFLLQLETSKQNNNNTHNNELVPQSIWNALEQMETVQKQLKSSQQQR